MRVICKQRKSLISMNWYKNLRWKRVLATFLFWKSWNNSPIVTCHNRLSLIVPSSWLIIFATLGHSRTFLSRTPPILFSRFSERYIKLTSIDNLIVLRISSIYRSKYPVSLFLRKLRSAKRKRKKSLQTAFSDNFSAICSEACAGR